MTTEYSSSYRQTVIQIPYCAQITNSYFEDSLLFGRNPLDSIRRFLQEFYFCVIWSAFSLNLTYRHFFRFFNSILLQDKENAYATNTFLFSDCNRLYTGKFSIHVIDLTRIDLATEEDKYYEIDRWAKLFKAATWEELKMIAKNDPDLMQASDELYKVNKDDILRQQARARADAEFWEKVHNARMEKMQEELSKKDAIISEKENVILEKDSVILEKDSVISEKDNEIKRLKEQLAQKS